MPLLTVPEFYTKKLYELDDRVYNNIERAFSRILGDKSRAFLLEHMDKTVSQLSVNDLVDVMSCFKILTEGGIS